MISVENLSARYGERQVLHEVDFNIAKGELVGLLGPNGSGKTTLLHCLSKVVTLHAGRVEIAAREISSYSAR